MISVLMEYRPRDCWQNRRLADDDRLSVSESAAVIFTLSKLLWLGIFAGLYYWLG